MSLINEALKRAGQLKPPPLPESTSQPVPESGVPAVSSQFSLVLGLLFMLVLLVVWLTLSGPESPRSSALTQPTAVSARQRALPERGSQPSMTEVVPGAEGRAPATPALPKNSAAALAGPVNPVNIAAITPQTNALAAAAEPPKPTFPQLKLQAIFYRPVNPWVMINSKTLRSGERLGEVQVLSITPQGVTVQWRGESKTLTLE